MESLSILSFSSEQKHSGMYFFYFRRIRERVQSRLKESDEENDFYGDVTSASNRIDGLDLFDTLLPKRSECATTETDQGKNGTKDVQYFNGQQATREELETSNKKEKLNELATDPSTAVAEMEQNSNVEKSFQNDSVVKDNLTERFELLKKGMSLKCSLPNHMQISKGISLASFTSEEATAGLSECPSFTSAAVERALTLLQDTTGSNRSKFDLQGESPHAGCGDEHSLVDSDADIDVLMQSKW